MFAFDKPFVWLIILVIVLVLFGASRLPDVGKSLGRSINEFKGEMNSGPDSKKVPTETIEPVQTATAKDDVIVTRRERVLEDGTKEVIIEERKAQK